MTDNKRRFVSIYKNQELFYKGYIDLKFEFKWSDEEKKDGLSISFTFSDKTVGITKLNLSKIFSTSQIDSLCKNIPLSEGKFYTNVLSKMQDSSNCVYLQIFEGNDLLLETYVLNDLFTKYSPQITDGYLCEMPIANQFQQIILNLTNNPVNNLTAEQVPSHIVDHDRIKFEHYIIDGYLYENNEVLRGIGDSKRNKIINNGSTTMYRVLDNKYYTYDFEPNKLTFKVDGDVIYEFIGEFNEIISPIQYWIDRRTYINVKMHSFKGKFIRSGKEFMIELMPLINTTRTSYAISKAFEIEIIDNKENIAINETSNLEDLIGLYNLKEQFKSFSNLMNYNKWRNGILENSGNVSIGLHMAFLGNPGTGKTTVAKKIGGLLKELEILKKGHVVVAERSTLVEKYIGQTAQKVKKIVESALDGVLFIDEAYSLYSESPNDYGHEAISTLITEMENNRENLVVIFAGYNDKMKRFFDMNEGLNSRISYKFIFDDYTSEEKIEILKSIIEQNNFIIKNDVLEQAKVKLAEVSSVLDSPTDNRYEFGNARGVRKFFEYMVQNIADRLAQETKNYTQPLPDGVVINEFLVSDLSGIKERFLMGQSIEQPKQIGFTV